MKSMSLPAFAFGERIIHSEIIDESFGGIDAVAVLVVVGSIIGVGYDDHIIVGDIGAHGVVADDSLPVTAEIIPSYHDRFTIGEPALDIV